MKRYPLKLFTYIVILSLIIQFYYIEKAIASGKIIYVNASGGADYSSIQEAIDAAEPGDTIYVYQGIYNENLIINKTITLQGYLSGAKIINGAKTGNVINIVDTSYVNISGFTIQNPVGQEYKCIMLNNAIHCRISENIIKNGNDGLYLLSSNNNFIYKNTIENNDANGLYLYLSENNKIYDNSIENNKINGIFICFSYSNEIYSNIISRNEQYGIRLQSSNNNIIYLNTFSNNLAGNAVDNSANFWSYSYKGNYWDDYNNYDNNTDGIGDVPYTIAGGSNKDNYPLGFFLSVKPIAVILSITPNPALKGEIVSFDGRGIDDGYIVNWEWSSSIDGLLSVQEDFTTSSLSIGEHIIKFRVRDNSNQWSEYASALLIIESNVYEQNKPPNATIIQIDPKEIEFGETVYMSGIGRDSDGYIVEYYWSSSIQGYLSNKQSFYISNLSIGEHTIYFKVRDNNNTWSNVASATVRVISSYSQNKPPLADAGGYYFGYTNQSILLNGSKSYDTDGYIDSYIWDFGDGSYGEGEIVEHTYVAPGTYVVNLTVIDNDGAQAVSLAYVTIDENVPNDVPNEEKEDKVVIPGFELIIFLVAIILAIISKIKIKQD